MGSAQTGKIAVGHPVDVASGTLFHEFEDYTLAGQPLLAMRRRYTGARTGRNEGMFGPGWFCPFDRHLVQDLDGFRMTSEDGESDIPFNDPDDAVGRGGVVRNLSAGHELKHMGDAYAVTKWDPEGENICFVFKKGRVGERMPLAAIRNLQGQGIDLQHDGRGRVVAVRQQRHGRGFRFEYNQNGRVCVVCVQTPAGSSFLDREERLVLSYDYDDNGLLCRMTDALDQTCEYAYDDLGRMIHEITLSGMDYTFRYDDRGRCIETAGAHDFGLNQLAYNDEGRFTQVTDALGQVTTYKWNANGQVEQEISPLGHAKTTVYDSYGRIVQTVSAEGRTTVYAFDDNGNRVTVISPGGAETHFAYDHRHQVIAVTDPDGHTWKREYDDKNRVTAVTNPLGHAMTFAYTATGEPAVVRDPAGNQRHLEWDYHGNLAGATDWQGNLTHFERDGEGRLTAVIDPKGHRTRATLDALGRVIRIIHPDGATESFEWDAFGQPTHHIDEQESVTTWQYTICGQTNEVVDPEQGRVRFEWSLIPGRLDAIVNQNTERYEFTYDAGGRLTSEKDFAGRTTVYEYDRDDLLTATVNNAGQRTLMQRNTDGAITTVLYADGSRTIYDYDARGLLINADNGVCAVERVYDATGRMVSEKQGDYRVDSIYNAAGNRIKRTSSLGGRTDFTWNANGLLTELSNQGFDPITLAYDANLNEIFRGFVQSVDIRQAHDSRNRLVEQFSHIEATRGNADDPVGLLNPIDRDYLYDQAGTLTTIKDNHYGVTEYIYDRLGRMLSASLNDKLLEKFTYDPAGNRLSSFSRDLEKKPGLGKELPNRCDYGPGNQVTRYGRTRYHYDRIGRLAEKECGSGKTVYTWDCRSQLACVHLPDGSVQRYEYDPFGRRTAKHGPDLSITYVWDGDVVLQECHQAEEPMDRKTIQWEVDPYGFAPLSKIDADAQYLCVNDNIGAPVALLDVNGRPAWRARLSAWGRACQATKYMIECPIRFQGQWHDAKTGLYYNRFRYYDPQTGRFISPDPIGPTGWLNDYLYAPNTTGWVDPYGLTSICPHSKTTALTGPFTGNYTKGIAAGTMNDFNVRKWYHQQLDAIPSKIIGTRSLRDQARQAFNLRNQARIDARALMTNRTKALGYDATDPIRTWQEQIRYTVKVRGIKGSEIWESILGSSRRSRSSVDKAFGLSR